jgi:hypothetical protein
VSGRLWRREIQHWVDALDYEALSATGPVPDYSQLPELELDDDGPHLIRDKTGRYAALSDASLYRCRELSR